MDLADGGRIRFLRPREATLARQLDDALVAYGRQHSLPGVADAARRAVLVEQLVESIRRVSFVSAVGEREISPLRADPRSPLFDPIKAALLHLRAGRADEASWLVFLSVHFGRHARAGWSYPRFVYCRDGGPEWWDWASVSADPDGFRAWLGAHQDEMSELHAGFGNHRKYESLDAFSLHGTGAVIESYVAWIAPPRTPTALFEDAMRDAHGDGRSAFERLYRSMGAVTRFGRTARFDYLTMIGKTGVSDIEPGSPYLDGATGPRKGAELLMGAGLSVKNLDLQVVELGAALNVGMQVLEDALCNWQKNPARFTPFRG